MWGFTHGEFLKSVNGLNVPPFPKDERVQVFGSSVVQKYHLKIYQRSVFEHVSNDISYHVNPT